MPMPQTLKRMLRTVLPTWSRDTFHLVRRSLAVAPPNASTVRFIAGALGDRVRRRTRPQAIVPDASIGAFYVRPFSSDLTMISTLIGPDGEYEPLRGRGDVKTVVDLGSNIGFTIRLWLRWFPGVRVIAVEPGLDNYELALLNVDAADRARVTLLNKAVSDQPGTLYLDRSDAAWAYHTRSEASAKTVAVDAWTVDQLIAPLGDVPIDLLKCDIEGAEESLFRSCGSWIGRVRNIVVETHRPYTLERMQADLAANGSALRLVHDNSSFVQHSIGIFSTPDTR